MRLARQIHFPLAPSENDIHSEYGRKWQWVLAPEGSDVAGMWRALGDADGNIDPNQDGTVNVCWTVADVKHYLGIEDDDPAIDANVANAMGLVQASIEQYCNRLLAYRENHTEMLYKGAGDGWQLHLWPVTDGISVAGIPCKEVEVDNKTGIAWFDHYSYTKRITATYSGGYKPCEWPRELMMVLLGSIGTVYQMMLDGGITNDSAISKITIPDVGTITYDNQTNSEIGSGGSFINGVIPMHWKSTLDFYRLHEC